MVDELETAIARQLGTCQERFSSACATIGSYPDVANNYYKVKVIVESGSFETTDSVTTFITDSLPQTSIVRKYVKNPVSLRGEDVFTAIYSSPALASKVGEAIQIITEALERTLLLKYALVLMEEKIVQPYCICTMQFYAAWNFIRKFPDDQESILSLFVKDPDPFDEITLFMEESRQRYNLHLVAIEDKMKPGLNRLKVQHPNLKAVLMGTRFTDPYSRNLTPFCETDEGWPSYMRINPILKWSYHEIWEFIRTLYLPYCVLYDRGYTSLGRRENTKRNEKLKYIDGNSIVRYRQAYTLQHEDFERNGRL